MCNKWNKKDLPHKGWTLTDVVDAYEYGFDDEQCEMCGTEIKYVHILIHPEVEGEIHVGCQCAEKLTNDYKNPKLREKSFKKRITWGNSKLWKTNEKGNFYRKYRGAKIIVFQTKQNQWKIGIRLREEKMIWGRKYFKSSLEARRYSLDGYNRLIERRLKAEEKWEKKCHQKNKDSEFNKFR